MPMTPKKKKILWIVAGVAVLVPILILLVVWARLDSIVQMGVEIGGKQILGVDTRLRNAAVSPLQGKVKLEGLFVGNPEGYTAESFVKMELMRVEANVGTLLKKEVHLREVTIDGPEFTYEIRNGKSNLTALLEKLDSKSGEKAPAEEKTTSEPVKLKIDLVHITNAKAHIMLLGKQVTASLPDIQITNIADANGNAIPANQVVKVLLLKMVAPIENAATGLFKMGKDLGASAGQTVTDTGKAAAEQGKKITEGVKDIFKKK